MAWHSRLSASKTKEWKNCAGFVPMDEYYPRPDSTGDAARLGTCAHALIERCLEEGVHPNLYSGRIIQILNEGEDNEGISFLRTGAKMPTKQGTIAFIVDGDMIEATSSFTDYVLARLCELFPNKYPDPTDYSIAKDAVGTGVLKLESRTNPLPERDDTGGTADITIDAWPEVLEIADYKNGTGVFVPVYGNDQLRSYTLGRAQEAGFDYEEYRYTIGQPRHYLAPPSGITFETASAEDLRAFEDELRAAAIRVDEARAILQELFIDEGAALGGPDPEETLALALLDKNGYLTVGDGGHCTWCPRRTKCPAAKRQVEEATLIDFEDDPEDEASRPEVPEDNSGLIRILKWADFIDAHIKRARKEAESKLLSGKGADGLLEHYKMVRKGGNRTWKPDLEEDAITEALVEEYGIEASKLKTEPEEPKLKSGPQVEKLLPKAKRKEFEEKFLYKPDGGLTMVKASDKREAVVAGADAADDFDEVEDEE